MFKVNRYSFRFKLEMLWYSRVCFSNEANLAQDSRFPYLRKHYYSSVYPDQVLAVDEDRVIDLKYTRHSPRLYKHTDVDTKRDDVKSDGSLKLHVGRIHLVIFYKMFLDIQVTQFFLNIVAWHQDSVCFGTFQIQSCIR